MEVDDDQKETAAVSGATFDPEGARRHMGVDPDGFQRVFNCIWNEVTRRRSLLDVAFAAGDLDGVALQAHTIKSSAASIGAVALSRAAAAVEAAARQQSTETLAAAMARFHAARETLSRLAGLG
jgi:HPt (histidine-containing phosphotransfer) domain-containing protein